MHPVKVTFLIKMIKQEAKAQDKKTLQRKKDYHHESWTRYNIFIDILSIIKADTKVYRHVQWNDW